MSLKSRLDALTRSHSGDRDPNFPYWTRAQAADARAHEEFVIWMRASLRSIVGEASDPGPCPEPAKAWADRQPPVDRGEVIATLKRLCGEVAQ